MRRPSTARLTVGIQWLRYLGRLSSFGAALDAMLRRARDIILDADPRVTVCWELKVAFAHQDATRATFSSSHPRLVRLESVTC